jgi:sporulation protein YtfJ
MQHPIRELLEVSMSQIKEMIEANTIIGTPICSGNTTIIPVSKVYLGFVSGGSDIKANTNKEDPMFGGGAGGGLTINPICFLVVNANEVKILSIDDNTHIIEKLVDLFPKVVDKTKTLFNENINIEKL